ncbi:hypothetical protein ACWDUL_20445 [Nocardia niigatensis]
MRRPGGRFHGRSLPVDVAERAVWIGITDPARIAELRPAEIPDDATRITFTDQGRHSFYLDPATARRALDTYAELWFHSCESDTGVHPLHIADGRGSDSAAFVAWSDGRLDYGRVTTPTRTELMPHEFQATQHLLREILDATNGADIGPETWMSWRGATRAAATGLAAHTDRRALGPTGPPPGC